MKPASSRGPTSGTHEGGNAERDGEDGGPNLGGGAGNGGSGGNADEGPALLRLQPSGDAILHVTASPRRVSRRALILFRLVRLAPPETPWGGASRRKSGAASSRRSTRRPPDARTPSPRPSSDPKREGGTEARVGTFRPGAMPAQRVARGRRIRGPRSISSKVADLLLPETPAGRGCF